MKYLLLSLLISSVSAKEITPVAAAYDYQKAPEFEAIMAQLKAHGDFSEKKVETKEETPAVKPMSRGQQAVEEAKARNRAILAQQNAEAKKAADQNPNETELDKWKREEKQTLNAWKQEVKDNLKQWQKEQLIFLGKIKVYQQNTFEIPAPPKKIVEKKVEVSQVPDVHVVNGTFAVPVRDQSGRATCSAFAGIRALEVILAQNSTGKDLSEQYLYWASKPSCQASPCTEKGSWVNSAFQYSKRQKALDIPTEEKCAYKSEYVSSNETQVPLESNCHLGSVKISHYGDVLTLSDVIENLKKDIPVIMAAKLSQNFYKNQGLVTLADSEKDLGIQMNGHSLGHAFLGVGVMELPVKLQAQEGNFCILVSNSWGKGWGAGGYSCLTENWLKKYRQPAPFVAVTKIEI